MKTPLPAPAEGVLRAHCISYGFPVLPTYRVAKPGVRKYRWFPLNRRETKPACNYHTKPRGPSSFHINPGQVSTADGNGHPSARKLARGLIATVLRPLRGWFSGLDVRLRGGYWPATTPGRVFGLSAAVQPSFRKFAETTCNPTEALKNTCQGSVSALSGSANPGRKRCFLKACSLYKGL